MCICYMYIGSCLCIYVDVNYLYISILVFAPIIHASAYVRKLCAYAATVSLRSSRAGSAGALSPGAGRQGGQGFR